MALLACLSLTLGASLDHGSPRPAGGVGDTRESGGVDSVLGCGGPGSSPGAGHPETSGPDQSAGLGPPDLRAADSATVRKAPASLPAGAWSHPAPPRPAPLGIGPFGEVFAGLD